MEAITAYRPLGLLSVVIIIGGLLFLLWRWPQGIHMTFSQHAAQQKASILYYFLLFTLTLPLLALFFIGWFAPTFHLHALFIWAIVLAMLLQYSVTIIPEVGGWKTTYHVAGSGASGICMVIALTILLFAPTLTTASKVVTGLSICVMLVIIGIGTIVRIKHARLLLLQSSFYAAFFMAVLFATYFGKPI